MDRGPLTAPWGRRSSKGHRPPPTWPQSPSCSPLLSHSHPLSLLLGSHGLVQDTLTMLLPQGSDQQPSLLTWQAHSLTRGWWAPGLCPILQYSEKRSGCRKPCAPSLGLLTSLIPSTTWPGLTCRAWAVLSQRCGRQGQACPATPGRRFRKGSHWPQLQGH